MSRRGPPAPSLQGGEGERVLPVRSTPRPWDALVWLAALTTSLFVYSFFGAVGISELPPLPAKPPTATDETEVIVPDAALERPTGAGRTGDEGRGLPHGPLKPEPEPEPLVLRRHGAPPVPGRSARPHPAAKIRAERSDETTPLPPPATPPPGPPPPATPPTSPPPTSSPTNPPPSADPLPAGDTAFTSAPSALQTAVARSEPADAPEDGKGSRPKHQGAKRRDGERPPPHARSEKKPQPVPDATLVPPPPAEPPPPSSPGTEPSPLSSPAAEPSPPSPPAAEPGRPERPGKTEDKKEKKET